MTADEELTDFLGSHITDNKREKIVSVLNERTRHFTVLLEDIYQPHNASACLRSCDCLGLQDVHIVESRNDYRPNNNVSMGSSKWLTLHRYHRAESAIETLKVKGYRLIATSPNEDGYDLSTLPIDKPVALLFGSEHKGLSASAIAAGYAHTCAIVSGGEVMCWGDNGNGQLGIGSRTDQKSPVTVPGATGYNIYYVCLCVCVCVCVYLYR
jgi:tRNA G18 (ribose-2'-O)-methylase SpoU